MQSPFELGGRSAGSQKEHSVRTACGQRAVSGHPEIETERKFWPFRVA